MLPRMETRATRKRSRPAWAGTADDVRALGDSLTMQVAPLRQAELASIAVADLTARTRERDRARVEDNWTLQAELEWVDGRETLTAAGTVDEILDKADRLTASPVSLRLRVRGDRLAGPSLIRVGLDRRYGAWIHAEQGPEPDTGRLVDVIEQQLGRRRPRGTWLLNRWVPLLAAVASGGLFSVALLVLAPTVLPTTWSVITRGIVAALLGYPAQGITYVLLTWAQRRLPRFQLHQPGETPELERAVRRFPAWLVAAVVVPLLVGLFTNWPSDQLK
jgi:hypothetical protein